jgi:pilus assembly protein CpaE
MHLPVILFSAATTETHKTRGFEAGADDYLTKPILNDELDNRIQAALNLAESRRIELDAVAEQARPEPPKSPEPPKRRGAVIGFWGGKGGVGVTTLAVNTAVALVEKHSVILGDLNVGLGAIVLQLGLDASVAQPSPWTLPAGQITQKMVAEALIDYSDSLKVLLMSEGKHWSPSVPLVETVFEHLRMLADFTVLDLGAGMTLDKFSLLHGCDHLVLVSGADRVASALTEHALESLDAAGIPRERSSVVMIQRRDTTGVLTPEVLERHLRVQLDGVVPIAQTDALWAFDRGEPVVTSLPESRLARSYRRFAGRLVRVIREES